MAEARIAPLLELRDVRAGYGDAVVLDGISLALGEGGTLAVLGRNGVGKSTLLLTLMGYTRLHRGTVLWQGNDISWLAPHRRARFGIGWVAQEREIFPSLTVQENLTVAARPGDWTLAPMRCSRASPSGVRTRATSSPAASSRCSPSRAH